MEILNSLGTLETNVSFKHLTTYRVGGNAKYVFYPNDLDSLISAIKYLKENNIDYKVFGNGSNILVSDDDYDGVIIKLNRTLNECIFTDNTIYAQAGCSIISLANQAALAGLSGLEFACGIPATVGGCTFMNAGAYLSDMSNIIDSVQVLDNDEVKWFTNKMCEFSYRDSYFKRHPELIIIAVNIKLEYKNCEEIIELMDKRRNKRLSSQPLNYPSCGSVFRNPSKDISAWQLIDKIGYRSVSYGDAYVSEKHSNFIVNRADATAEDINRLITDIQIKVKEKFDIDLICEVERFNWKK